MKYIGTNCFISNLEAEIINKKTGGSPNYHSQFRIVCKARGIKHANELTSWLTYKPFSYSYSSETGNKKELSFFEKDKNITFIVGRYNSYITDIELKKMLHDHLTEKGGDNNAR